MRDPVFANAWDAPRWSASGSGSGHADAAANITSIAVGDETFHFGLCSSGHGTRVLASFGETLEELRWLEAKWEALSAVCQGAVVPVRSDTTDRMLALSLMDTFLEATGTKGLIPDYAGHLSGDVTIFKTSVGDRTPVFILVNDGRFVEAVVGTSVRVTSTHEFLVSLLEKHSIAYVLPPPLRTTQATYAPPAHFPSEHETGKDFLMTLLNTDAGVHGLLKNGCLWTLGNKNDDAETIDDFLDELLRGDEE